MSHHRPGPRSEVSPTVTLNLTEYIPTPLLWSMAATGLCLLLTGLACAFVWLAMDTGTEETPSVYPPAVQPGPPIRGR